MRLLLTIILLLIASASYSQQLIELCDDEPEISITYWVTSNTPTELLWWVNGFPYEVEQLTIVWDSVGVYDIAVTSNSECPSDTQRIEVVVTRCEQLIYYIPNAFTPDGDNWNNTFQPVFTEGFDPYDFHMVIYNRWGEIVFESFDASKGWNGFYGGIRCQDGVYTWKIDFGLKNKTDDKITETGHVVILR